MNTTVAIHDLEVLEEQLGPRLAPGSGRAESHEGMVHHVLAEALFRDTLLRERRRSERTGAPFAVLLVDASDSPPGERRWAPVLRAVAAAKREIDVLGWFEQGTVLGLILPEAHGAGALKVLDRVRSEIRARRRASAAASFSLRLYTHADPGSDKEASLPAADLLIEACGEDANRQWQDRIKRAVDIIGSLAFLVLLSPVFLAVFLAVKLGSPGPALFKQVRIGWRNRPFTMLKFRTMHQDADDGLHRAYVSWFIECSSRQPRSGDDVFKLKEDRRVTRLGRFLRRTSLDELPQFWNVLRGDMSLVGPRPPLPFEVEQYQPWHRRRVLDTKPGLTGPWQIGGRSRTTFEEMVRMDLRYARTRSLWTDIRILAATARAVLFGKGAY